LKGKTTFWQLLPALRLRRIETEATVADPPAAITGWGAGNVTFADGGVPRKGVPETRTRFSSVAGQLLGTLGTVGVGETVTLSHWSEIGTLNGLCTARWTLAGTPGVRFPTDPEIANTWPEAGRVAAAAGGGPDASSNANTPPIRPAAARKRLDLTARAWADLVRAGEPAYWRLPIGLGPRRDKSGCEPS
jgi:hypothetical protein